MGDMFVDLHWMPEVNSTEPYKYYIFFPMHTYDKV